MESTSRVLSLEINLCHPPNVFHKTGDVATIRQLIFARDNKYGALRSDAILARNPRLKSEIHLNYCNFICIVWWPPTPARAQT